MIYHISIHVVGSKVTVILQKGKYVQQKSISKAISCSGIGIHSGKTIHLTLHPAEPGTGIVFKRTDITDGNTLIQATWENVVDTTFSTNIGNAEGARVATVEHIMAAFCVMGIDNIIVELSGAEVPVMDGSAAPFLFLLDCAGIKVQAAPRKYMRILKEISVAGDGGRLVSLSPGSGFSVAVDMPADGRNPFLPQSYVTQDVHKSFKSEIARARTYGFYEDAQKMWDAGLSKGASLDNTVVIADGNVMNENGFRFNDECVRHKVLDVVGDMYLLGMPLIGHFYGKGCGHMLQNKLIQRVFDSPDSWSIEEGLVSGDDKVFLPKVGAAMSGNTIDAYAGEMSMRVAL